ncbi:MAG: glycoside hydrolase family 3 C-terminal domain-containing protein [Oscillospiraceae bacterium]|nr:glycoside hydrolase family 3 C-terminal domain-containing protein [Oscillospiraceae bacterium]
MDFKQKAQQLTAQMTLQEKLSQLKYNADAIPRLGIPAYNWWNEALHGVARSGAATVFPQAIAMASSFNAPLLEQVGSAIADEARAKYNEYKTFGDTMIYQGITCWSPNVNIYRDPRWGRGHETYGEDPYLTGVMGTAYVKGMQGEGKYRKCDATLKHFAVHSGPEEKRHHFDAKATEKDMYETYLWAFKYIIDNAQPAAVMGAYNRLNGEACCASKTLLKDILKDEFGFDGYIVSDCGAIRDINENHKITSSLAESAALAVKCGCDLNCGSAYLWLGEAYEKGYIDGDTITKSVERLMEARYRLGMFSDDCEYDNIPYSVVECDEHIALCRKMAQEGIVLLKNNGILPLGDKYKNIAVIGPNAQSITPLFSNYYGRATRHTTLLQGMIDNAPQGVKIRYAWGCDLCRDDLNPKWEEIPTREAILAAKASDVVVMCMGLDPGIEGEQGDTYNTIGLAAGDRATINLPKSQQDLYAQIEKLGKPIVFVNMSGGCVNLVQPDKTADAVVQVFYPGAQGGNALADILYGKVSPSGRLPVTFYADDADLPDFEDYSMENRTYKFFKGQPLYPFGHGLSYSTVTENWLDDNTVQVANTGKADTAYTVLKFEYIPHKNLCGFKKVFLKAGETQTVKFE